MAFLFGGGGSATSDQSDGEGKQNIFAASGGGASQPEGGQASGNTFQTSSTDGGVIGSTPSGGNGAAPAPAQSQAAAPAATGGYNPKALSTAYGNLAEKIKLPTQALGQAQSQVSGGQQKLQDESNKYTAAAVTQKNSYNLGSDVLEKAAGGDEKAFQAAGNRLAKTSADPFAAFSGLGDKLPNVDKIKNTSRIYEDEAGPNYSRGASNLDQALLRRNGQFLNMQNQILGDSQKLIGDNDKAVSDLTANTRKDLQSSFASSTDDIKARLGGMSGKVVDDLKARQTAEQARRASLSAADIAREKYGALKEKIRGDTSQGDPNSLQARSAKELDSLDPSELAKFVNIDKDVDWHELVGQGDADRFNRINGLLGKGDTLTASNTGAGPDYNFDEGNAYKNVMANITGRRGAKDRANQTQMDSIMEAAKKTAGERIASDGAQDARGSARKSLRDWAEGQYGELGAINADSLFWDDNMGDVTSRGLVHENSAPSTWSDYLTGDQAAQYNTLSQDNGGRGDYAAKYKPEYDLEELKKYFTEKRGQAVR